MDNFLSSEEIKHIGEILRITVTKRSVWYPEVKVNAGSVERNTLFNEHCGLEYDYIYF